MKMKSLVRQAGVVVAATAMVTLLTSITGTGAVSAAKPKGTTLLIGWIGSETSSISSGSATVEPDTLAAWIKWTNAHGGVAGHPVEAIYENDKGDPAQSLADMQTLVQTDHVLAIVGEGSDNDETFASYALAQRVPVIGGVPIDATWYTNPMFYPVAADVTANLWGQMEAAKVQGVKRVGVLLCTEVPACAQAEPVFKSVAKSVGMEVTYDALASETQPSYTAECLAAKEAKVQALAAYVNDVVLGRDCVRQGLHALWIQAGYVSIQEIQTVDAFGNTVGSSGDWLCEGPEQPQTAAFNEAMAKYEPQYDKGTPKFEQEGPGDCDVWASAMAFAKAVENAKVASSAVVTRDDIIRGLSKFKNEKLGGYAPDITYSNGTKPNPIEKCVYLYKWKGTTFLPVPAGLNKYTCEP